MKIFDNIMSWKKPEMLDLAKELNIKGRSKMNKGEVAESISKILLSDEYFKTSILRRFLRRLTKNKQNVL